MDAGVNRWHAPLETTTNREDLERGPQWRYRRPETQPSEAQVTTRRITQKFVTEDEVRPVCLCSRLVQAEGLSQTRQIAVRKS
jgi:hypothetical protein